MTSFLLTRNFLLGAKKEDKSKVLCNCNIGEFEVKQTLHLATSYLIIPTLLLVGFFVIASGNLLATLEELHNGHKATP